VRLHRQIAVVATTITLVVVLVVAVGGSRAAPPSGGAGQSAVGFCSPDRQARDFGFSSLPPVHELDTSTSGEELGHPHVHVEGGLQEVRSVDRPGKFGYRFVETSSPKPVFVHWTFTETMWAVDANGRHAVEVGYTGQVVNSINVQHEVSIELPPPHRDGFYRFDLRIIAKGKTIGTYSSYMKMVWPSWRARLQLEHRAVPAGGRVRWRLGNLGTEQIAFGSEPTVQRMEDGSWSRVHGVDEGLSLLMEFYLWPGGENGCSSLHLPADLTPGRYRLVEGVELFHWPKNKPNDVTLKAPFTVLASG
jgi:hypothetical protein